MKTIASLVLLLYPLCWPTVDPIGASVPREPMDVPAIQARRIVRHKGDGWACANLMYCVADEDEYGYFPTCADKSRVLLTDEAGNRHCIKF